MATKWRITIPVEMTITVSDEFDHLFEDPGELDQHAEWLYDQACGFLPYMRPTSLAAIHGQDPAEIIGHVTSVNYDCDDYDRHVKIKELKYR